MTNPETTARLAAVQRDITTGVQRYARAADRADDARVEALTQQLRSYVHGLKDGLISMGLREDAAREVIRKAGWDFATSSYRVYERPSMLAAQEKRRANA